MNRRKPIRNTRFVGVCIHRQCFEDFLRFSFKAAKPKSTLSEILSRDSLLHAQSINFRLSSERLISKGGHQFKSKLPRGVFGLFFILSRTKLLGNCGMELTQYFMVKSTFQSSCDDVVIHFLRQYSSDVKSI